MEGEDVGVEWERGDMWRNGGYGWVQRSKGNVVVLSVRVFVHCEDQQSDPLSFTVKSPQVNVQLYG